jgi:glycerophosphoryl diester phosphodiesterase
MTSIATATGASLGPSAAPLPTGYAAAPQLSLAAAFLSSMPQQRRAVDPAFVTTFPPAATAVKTATTDALRMPAETWPVILPEKSLKHHLNVDSVNHAVAHPTIVGHRGALYFELENTREGFQKCADMGCDAVELDVFLLKCGTLVVFHGGGTDENPGDLWDYCGVKGGILDLTYEQAKELQFNANYGEFPCPANSIHTGVIPTLEEVLLDARASGLHIKIELKGPNTAEPTLELVDRLNLVQQCSFSSFDLDQVALVRQLRPQKTATGEHLYKTGALFNDIPSDFIQQAQSADASEVHLRYDTCTSGIISQIHNAGMGSMAWFRGPIGMASDTLEKYWDVGNEDEIMYATLLRTGVQSLCLNKPDVMIGLQRYREHMMLDQPPVYESYGAVEQPFLRAVQAVN